MILAGITISVVLSDNGVITQAQEAKTNAEREKKLEEIRLDLIGKYTENLGSLSWEDVKDVLELKSINFVESDGQVVSVEVPGVGNVPFSEIYSGTISNGAQEAGLTPAQVKAKAADYYGEKVVYDCPIEGYEWQIYYSDGTNIYITTTDYISEEHFAKGKGNVDPGNLALPSLGDVTNNYSGSADIRGSVVESLLSQYFTFIGSDDKETTNIKEAAYLLDTEAWSGFKSEKAKYAIGAPTIELFVNSYDDLETSKYLEIRVQSENGYDFKYNTDEDSAWTNGWLTSNFTDHKGLYYPTTATSYGGQWLASPWGQDSNSSIKMNGGTLTAWDSGYGIRPIVCLKGNVELAD